MVLQAVAELAFRQVYPNPSIQNKTHLAEFIQTAKLIYADRMYYDAKEKMATEGEFEVPSNLLVAVNLPISGDTIDISGLKIMRSLDKENWIINVGGIDCGCEYVKHTLNTAKLLCNGEYDGKMKPYIPFSNYIKFPKGIHGNKKEIEIIYASDGTDLENGVEINEVIGNFVRVRLLDIYLGKTGKQDKTNNNNTEV
jgi:hypothetical protein